MNSPNIEVHTLEEVFIKNVMTANRCTAVVLSWYNQLQLPWPKPPQRLCKMVRYYCSHMHPQAFLAQPLRLVCLDWNSNRVDIVFERLRNFHIGLFECNSVDFEGHQKHQTQDTSQY